MGGDKLDGCVGDLSFVESGGDDFRNGNEGFGGFFVVFEDGCVVGFDGEIGDVGDDFGVGFEDDEEDVDGGGDMFEDEVVVELGFYLKFVDCFVLVFVV